VPARRKASLDQPDERVEFNGVVDELVTLGDVTIGRATQAVGWRWSVDWKPTVGGDWCEGHHIGIMLSGRQGIEFPDGTVVEYGPNDAFDIAPGHDGYTIGDEPAVFLEWSGVRTWIAAVGGLNDRVLATLLFTDLVGSTAIASELGDTRWRDRLEGHYGAVRAILDQYRGRLIETTGDGVLASFDGPAQAVRAALAVRRAAVSDGLAVRAAVHVGEVEVVGERVRGLAVVHAARLLALADAGDVLVSESTRALLGSLRITFQDRGEHALKGIPGRQRVHAVVMEDGRARA
jgi:class 3 adenylate cyclase